MGRLIRHSSAQNGPHQRRVVTKDRKLMVFTLIQAASKKWLRLKGRNQLPKVNEGIKFNDGVEVTADTKNRAA